MTKKSGSQDVKKIKKIKKVDVDGEKGSFFFVALIGLLVVGAAGGVLALAVGRESNVGIAPEAGGEIAGDHWHWAYSVYSCGETFTPATLEADPDGIHTHGDGLAHIHPFRTDSAGRNAQVGVFFNAFGGELTDDSYTPGPSEQQTPLSEEQGCDGQPATLKLAYWEDAFNPGDEPTEIIEEDIAGFRFEHDGGMMTLALVADGEEIPPPPADRIQVLNSSINGPDPIGGLDEGVVVTGDEVDVDAEATDEEADEVDVDAEATDDEADEVDVDAEATDEEADEDAG